MDINYRYNNLKRYSNSAIQDTMIQRLVDSADSIYCEKDCGTIVTVNLDNFVAQTADFKLGGADRMFKLVNGKVGGGIKKVIFNDPATIVYWNTGEKTVVKCTDGEAFDKEKGLLCAILKYECGNDNRYHRLFKEWCD